MRIAGITLPEHKRLDVALTVILGIGPYRARKVLDEAEIDPARKPGDLTADEEAQVRQAVESYTIEGELRRERSGNIKRLRDIQSYRGMRHSRRLPSRGQRTKSNSRTRRGNVRQTMGTGRRKVDKK